MVTAARVDVVAEVLARVADDAQPVRGRIEVDAEEDAVERDRQLRHESCLAIRRADRIDAASVADSVKFSILNPEIDAHEGGVRRPESRHPPDVARPGRAAFLELHESLIRGEAQDRRFRALGQVVAVAAVRVRSRSTGRERCRERRRCQKSRHRSHRTPPSRVEHSSRTCRSTGSQPRSATRPRAGRLPPAAGALTLSYGVDSPAGCTLAKLPNDAGFVRRAGAAGGGEA